VKVRVLVDDIDARAKHDLFQVADLHPNIEVRIFNPFYSRSGWFGQLTEWMIRGRRLNRRMHNKAWIVDNRIAIVGGRNIGDEYFGASDVSNFADLDLVLAGPIVDQISASFDEYWNNPNAVPVDHFERKPPPPEALTQLLEDAKEYRRTAARARTSPRFATCRSALTCWPRSRRRSRSARRKWNCWSTIPRRSASNWAKASRHA
jgi:putative cardiolipin synthase